METRGNNTAASDVKLRARGGGEEANMARPRDPVATPRFGAALDRDETGKRRLARMGSVADRVGWQAWNAPLNKHARAPPACTSSPSATSGRETQERRALRPAAGGIYRRRVAFVPHASFCRQCKLRPSTSDKAPAGGGGPERDKGAAKITVPLLARSFTTAVSSVRLSVRSRASNAIR